MKIRLLFAGLLLASSVGVAAAAPPSAPAYQVTTATYPQQPSYVNLNVAGWLDETDTSVLATGSPHPVSQSKPLPVQCITGCSGGGGGGGSVTQGAGSNSNPWTTQGPTLTWQGNLTVAAATSTAFSSTTINDGALPTTAASLTYLLAINQGANPVTICFQGGTCTATTGVIIPAGGFKSNPLPGTALPSFYSTSGTIVSLSNG